MADLANNFPENVPGRYYVDDQCIDCDLCRQTAPNNFQRDEQSGHSFVFRQPQTPEEETQCEEAMASCPVEAIGSNGDLAATFVAEQACPPWV
jgi:ferredoxin